MVVHPFDRSDVPRAERLVAAPVEVVYGALDAVTSWSDWLATIDGPVRATGAGSYEMDRTLEGRSVTHRLTVTTRGPVHTLFIDVDDGTCRLHFRTRPQGAATRAEVVLTLAETRAGRRAVRRRRRARQLQDGLDRLLAGLAAHVEDAPR